MMYKIIFFMFVILFANSCENQNTKTNMEVVEYLLDSILQNQNNKEIILLNNFDATYKKEDFYMKFIENEYDFDSVSVMKQLNDFVDKKVKIYPNPKNKLEYKLPYQDQILCLISPPIYSINERYILLYIKTITNTKNNYYWSWQGIIINQINGIYTFNNIFTDDKKLSFENHWNNEITYMPFGENFPIDISILH